MAIEPKAGLVIYYDFLWKHEEKAGHTQGLKDRPCAIVAGTKERPDGSRDILLCAITHTPPTKNQTAVEIPYKEARNLNLDHDRMWVKTHQVNVVVWEKDRVPDGMVKTPKGEWSCGTLPVSIGKQVFNQVRENRMDKSLESVRREPDPYIKEYLDKQRGVLDSAPDQENENDDGNGR